MNGGGIYTIGWHPFSGCTSGGVYVLVFTRMPGRSSRTRLGSLLLCLCGVFRSLINSFCLLHAIFSWLKYICNGAVERRTGQGPRQRSQ